MILIKNYILYFVISILFSVNLFALSPQQYCEKLHSKRPTGATTSYELLNVDFLSDDIKSYSIPTACRCNNGTYGTSPSPTGADCASACSSAGGHSGALLTDFLITYSYETKATKECKNGTFVYKKEQVKQYLNSRIPTGETATSTVCQGTGC